MSALPRPHAKTGVEEILNSTLSKKDFCNHESSNKLLFTFNHFNLLTHSKLNQNISNILPIRVILLL